MKQIYAVFFSLTLTGLVHANEPVTPNTNAPVARKWQKEDDRIIGHIRSSKLAAMKNTTANIMSIFHDSILTQDALNPVWHGEYFPAINGGPQVKFGIRCIFTNSEDNTTNNDLTVFANDLSPLQGHLKVNGNEFTTLKANVDAQGSHFEFDTDNGLRVKAWLITADSTNLPYTAVTRKEYLDQARKELENLKDIVVADDRGKVHIRTAAEQEVEKQQMLQQLRNTYTGAELEARTRVYLHNYMRDEDLVLQTIARDVAAYNQTIRLMDHIEGSMTPQQLAKPAVVSVKAEAFRGFEDGLANTTMLVRMNPAYFTGSDDQAPKFLLVCFRFNPAESMANGIDHQLAENFNGRQFQSLLAK